MSTVCKFVYLDHYGEPSAIYDKALEDYGAEEAEAIYIRHMFDTGDIKFSLGEKLNGYAADTMKLLSNMHKNVKKPDSKSYPVTGVGKLDRVTQWVGNLPKTVSDIEKMFARGSKKKTKILEDPMEDKKKTREWAKNYLPKYLEKFKSEFALVRGKDIKKYIEDVKKNNKVEYEQWVDHVVNRWEASTKYGTAVHEVFEFILENLQKKRNKDPLMTGRTMKIAGHKMLFEAVKKAQDKHNIKLPKYTEFGGILDGVLQKIETVERSMNLDPGKLIIKPEQRVYSETLGLAGSIDVLLINPYDRQVKILDIKTKTEESLENFHRMQQEVIGGPFMQMENNPANKASAQMSVYAAILVEAGFTVSSSNDVIVVEGQMWVPPDERKKRPDKQSFLYEVPKLAKIQPMTNRASKVIEYLTTKDYNAMLAERRRSGAAQVFDNFTGNQVTSINNNVKDYIANREAEVVKDSTGQFFYLDNNPENKDTYRHRVYITPEEKANPTFLKDIFKEEYRHVMSEKERLASAIIEYFNDPSPDRHFRFSDKEIAVGELLQGIDPSTHTLEIAEEAIPALYGDLGPDILIARRLDNPNVISIFSVNSSINKPLKFDATTDRYSRVLGKQEATSILGKYRTDAQLEADNILRPEMKESATHHDVHALRVGLAVIRFRNSNPTAKVEHMKVGSILGVDYKAITPVDLEEQINILRKFKEVVPEGDFPADIAKLLGDHKVNNAKMYGSTAIDQLIDILSLNDYRAGSLIQNYSRHDTDDKLIMNLRKKRRGILVDQELIDQLAKLQARISKKKTDPIQEEELALVAEVILQLHQFKMNSDQLVNDKMSSLNQMRAAATIGDHYIQKMELLRERYTRQLKGEFMKFNREHQKLLKDLFKDAGISTVTGFGMTKVFKDLFISPDILENGKFDPSKQESWMMLKKEDDPSLSAAQKAYIKFFNKHVKQSLIKSVENENHIENIENDQYYEAGMIPIMKGYKKVDTTAGFKEFTKSFGNFLVPRSSDQTEKYDLDSPVSMVYKAKFGLEATDAGVQHSQSRRKKLSIENSGEAIEHKAIEMNLAVILSAVVNDGLKKQHLGTLNAVNNAVDTYLYNMEKIHPRLDTKNSRKFLAMANRMNIHDQYKNEGEWAKSFDKVGRAASTMIFTLSSRQAMIEFSTAWVQGTSSMMANGINKFLFKTKSEDLWFEPKNWFAAVKIWNPIGSKSKWNKKAQTMAEDNDMLHPDPENLTSPEFTKHNKYQAFQSKALWGMNTWSVNNIISQTFVAYAMHKGFWEAYVLDADGEFVYDETKDTRFYVYDPKTDLGHKDPPSTKEEKKKHALWKTVKGELKAEGQMYTEGEKKGRMMVPLSTIERKSIKQYATRIFGSMSKDSIIFANFFAVGRAMGRYKRWFAQKISNYWTPSGESQTYQTREWIEEDAFSALLSGDIHAGLSEDLEAGQTVIIIPEDLAVEVGDILKFGASDSEYEIAAIDGNKVTLATPIKEGESYTKDTALHIKRAEGYWRWKQDNFEGIIQSAMGLSKLIRTEGLKGFKNMSRIQKENLSKLLSDMIMLILALQLAKFVLDNENIEFTQTPVGRTISRAFTNAYGELNIGITAYGMTDNIFPAIATFGNQLENLAHGVAATATGNAEAAEGYLSRGFKTFGSIRSVTDVAGSIIGED